MARTLALAIAVLLGFGAARGASAAFQAGSGAVAYWPLDTAVGATTPDIVAPANDFTFTSAPASIAGVFGNARTLDGVDDDFRAASAADLNFGTGSFTVALWIRPTNTGSVRLINKWDGPLQQGWIFDIHSTTGGTAQVGSLRFRLDSSTTSNAAADNVDMVAAAGLDSGTWRHVAAVVDRTAAQMRLYMDGAPVGAAATSIPATITSLSNTFQVGVGTIPTATGKYYNGAVDDIRLYNRALSAAEMTALFLAIPPTGVAVTNGVNSVSLNWSAVGGATGYSIRRSSTSGGPYTQVGTTTAPTVTFTDNTATNPNTYFYVVQALFTNISGPYSAQVTGVPLPPPVTVTPTSGLTTDESGATTTFSILFNQAPPAAGSQVTVTSGDASEGLVSSAASPTPATSITFMVASGFTGYIPITVTGVDDSLDDGNITFNITITATNMGGPAIPSVSCTNNDNDTSNITINQTAGHVTNESGGQSTFSVTFTTQPTATTTLSVTSSNTAEGTVSPASLTFTAANWNLPHVVTLTGVDDSALDFGIGYTVSLSVTGGDAAYQALTAAPSGPRTVSAINMDNEAIPALDPVWGGGSGGCGLLGAEAALLILLGVLHRRRRS